MLKRITFVFCLALAIHTFVCASDDNSEGVEIVRYKNEFSSAKLQPARTDGRHGIAVVFKGTSDLHYYARKETAPAGYKLKIEAKSAGFDFGDVVFPKWGSFFDSAQGKNVEVYVGGFVVFIPITNVKSQQTDIQVTISGIACTSEICLSPFEKTLQTRIDYAQADSWQQYSIEKTEGSSGVIEKAGTSIWFALGLALLAGLSLNIMPCIWPVLPIIVMQMVRQAKRSRGKSIALGLAFCVGILLFFAALAAANIVLQVFYGTVLQWGDQFRSPVFVTIVALLLLELALFMFGVFTIALPSSVTSKAGSGSGYTGAIGTGFLAAILSTPCSFAILAAAFAWAQAQPLFLATVTIMVIGAGMAIPYAILTSLPGLLKALPKPGRWMELFKQALGFILLAIAVWMITVLPESVRAGVMFFAVALGFCTWMWAGWVSFDTKLAKKWLIRIIAVTFAFAAGWIFLQPKAELIDWQKYDAEMINNALNNHRPVLIKFSAQWCASCKVVEKLVYSKRDVTDLIKRKNVLAVNADTTIQDYPATGALKNVYKEPGVPVSILFVPYRDEPFRWRGKFFNEELKEALNKIPEQ